MSNEDQYAQEHPGAQDMVPRHKPIADAVAAMDESFEDTAKVVKATSKRGKHAK